MKSLLIVFAKTPVLGSVKTRLAKEIGNGKALELYLHLLRKTDRICQQIKPSLVLFYSGENTKAFGNLFASFEKRKQNDGDLGIRMEMAFQWGFSQGYKKVIIIGTDLWELDRPILEKAFLALENQDHVIGPAQDGGYYLLGMKEPTPQVFKNKKWSSPSVLKETLLDLKGKSIVLLEEKNDLDTLKDLVQIPELMNHLNIKNEGNN